MQSDTIAPNGRASLLLCSLADFAAIEAHYLPWMEWGGVMAAANRKFLMGEEVFVLLELGGGAEKYSVQGKVAWLPTESSSSGFGSVGIHFSKASPAQIARKRLEAILGGRETL